MSQKRYAYLIGANGPEEQGIEPLHYAVQDIEHLEKALSGYPCEFTKVEKVIASSSSVVTTGLELLANACLPTDLLFIHFAGHAFLFDRHLYLICDNTDIRRKLFSSTAIDIDTIKTILGRCKAKHKLLILDCCHAAAAHDGGTWRGDQALEYALEELKGNANFILSACASNKRTRELEKLEFEHDRGAGFLSWALASACGPEFPTVAQDQALSLTDFWNWLPKVLEAVNSDLPKNEQIPTPKLFGEKELGDDEMWFTARRREAHRSSSQEEHRHREELAMLEGEDYLHHYCPGADVEDFDRSKVLEYATRDGASGRLASGNLKQLCIQLGLASSLGTPTRAAVLVFHRAPDRYLHSALVRVIAKASTNGSYAREQIKGSLGEQIDKTLKWIISNLRTISENTGIGQRVDRCELPERALRELVVNAIVHRDYTAKENVKIEITPKKVIITNPGRLIPAIVNCDPPFAYRNSHPHNPSLLNVLVEQQWAEGLSRGFEIVQEEFQKFGLPLPEIRNLDNGLVQVTIERPDISVVNAIEANMRETIRVGLPSPTISQAPQTFWNIPYRRNRFFTGREEVLQQLHEELSSNKASALTQAQAISGLGGIGKTQIAVEYAYRYHEEYDAVLWVYAATREVLISSFMELASVLQLPEREEKEQQKIIEAVQQWFRSHERWLLIVDNADDLSMVEEFLPAGDKGYLLLTTRVHAPGTLAHGIEVERFDLQESMLLLMRRAKVLEPFGTLEEASANDRAAAEAIAREMDGLPLALDQAGAYIEETGCRLSSYLEQYRRRQTDLLQRRGEAGKEHPVPVATTWSLSFEQVEQHDPVAADLLRFCAFLAPDAIPEQLIVEGADELGPQLERVAVDPGLLDDAIRTLLRFSIVKRKPDEQTITVHRLVQAILRNSMDAATQQAWAERTIRAINQSFPDATDYHTWPYCQQLLPHAEVCAIFIDQWHFVFPEAGWLCNLIGVYLYQRAQYNEAETFYQHAIAIGEQALGSEHPDLATYLNNLAQLYGAQGKYTEAEPLLLHAIAIDEKALGSEHPGLATDLNNLANLYSDQGKYAEAELLYRRAIAIGEKTLGPEHSALATRLNNLANLYSDQGKYAEAEPLLQRAIVIDEKVLGPEHPDLATDFNNLALLYHAQGKYAVAEPLYQRAISVGEKTLGPEHPDLSTELNNLANLYYAQGKYAVAEPLYQRAISIGEKALGPEHPSLAKRLNNLSLLYKAQGKYDEAAPLLQRSISIGEQVLGSEHPDVATWLNNLAALYADEGKYAEAEPLYQRAIAIAEKALGQEHPSTMAYRQNYETLLKNKQEYG